MIRNSIVAGATAVVVAFAIWFQSSATVSHEVKDEERSGADTSQVDTGPDTDAEPGEAGDDGASAPGGGDGAGDEPKDETRTDTGAHTGKPGEVKP